MGKKDGATKAAETTNAEPVRCEQVQKVLGMLEEEARFKNCNSEDLEKLTKYAVSDLFNTPEGRRLLHGIPNKITVIKADGSETQMPVFTNPELASAGEMVKDGNGEPIPHVKDKKSKSYVPVFEMEVPGKDATDEERKAATERYGTHSTAVIKLPLIDPKAQDGDTVLLSAKEAWQQWNRGHGNKKKKSSKSKSGIANDPIAYCNKMIAAATTDAEKEQWMQRLTIFTQEKAKAA